MVFNHDRYAESLRDVRTDAGSALKPDVLTRSIPFPPRFIKFVTRMGENPALMRGVRDDFPDPARCDTSSTILWDAMVGQPPLSL